MTLSAATATHIPARIFAAKRIGRPRGGDPASARTRKPWLALGMSERTFYRRQAAAPAPPPKSEQQLAHVAAWFATLSSIAQLEHKAWARRCLIACRPRPEWPVKTEER